ncbi:SPRE1 protein, partial [Atractosteus spatula]|nr:SPRE1 protein [Atractosteus spatula]
MTRDDSSGGWVPLGGGGLSHVIICKGRSLEDRGRRDYIIRGERLRDRAPVLECAVQRGLVYNKVNPIFHHWRVQDKKFGLTFQSPADAVSFERGLHSAIDRLDRGSDSPSSSTPEEGDTEDDGLAVSRSVSLSPSVLCECVSLSPLSLRFESSSSSRKEMLPRPATIVTSQSSATCFVRPPATEDYGYGTGHTVATPTPAQIHTRPLQHQPAPVTASCFGTITALALWSTEEVQRCQRGSQQNTARLDPWLLVRAPPAASGNAEAESRDRSGGGRTGFEAFLQHGAARPRQQFTEQEEGGAAQQGAARALPPLSQARSARRGGPASGRTTHRDVQDRSEIAAPRASAAGWRLALPSPFRHSATQHSLPHRGAPLRTSPAPETAPRRLRETVIFQREPEPPSGPRREPGRGFACSHRGTSRCGVGESR